jgi:hypothetical protein
LVSLIALAGCVETETKQLETKSGVVGVVSLWWLVGGAVILALLGLLVLWLRRRR